MAEAHSLQREYQNALNILKLAEKVFPGEKLIFEKKVALHKLCKENTKRDKNKFKKMFAKK